jgi:hypothetical protein
VTLSWHIGHYLRQIHKALLVERPIFKVLHGFLATPKTTVFAPWRRHLARPHFITARAVDMFRLRPRMPAKTGRGKAASAIWNTA